MIRITRRKIIGLAATAVIAVATWCTQWVVMTNNRMQALQLELAVTKAELAGMRAAQDTIRQDDQNRMFWKYHKWLHWQIDLLRHKAGLEPAEKPDFR